MEHPRIYLQIAEEGGIFTLHSKNGDPFWPGWNAKEID